jgi:outer membrane lipoprotein-sorting protein
VVRRRLAWLVPAAVTGLVIAGATVGTSGASTTPHLAPRTVAQLIAGVEQAPYTALSGTMTETANLGLPDLAGEVQSASLSWQTFLTGTHSVRVWMNGPTMQRLAVIGELSEADVVHSGRDVWTYTSDTNTVSHTRLPAGAHNHFVSPECGPLLTPAQAAARLLKHVSPSTSVTRGANTTVAGKSAYTLVITPRDARSTVRQITVAIDSAHLVPLQLEVFGASSSPAIKIGFSDVSFATPAVSTFHFHAPAGASVTKNPFVGGVERGPAVRQAPTMHQAQRPRVLGSHWTTVLELRDANTFGPAGGLLEQLTTPVGTSGMRLLHTALVNVVVTSDGRAFIGALQPAALEHLAATTAG